MTCVVFLSYGVQLPTVPASNDHSHPVQALTSVTVANFNVNFLSIAAHNWLLIRLKYQNNNDSKWDKNDLG